MPLIPIESPYTPFAWATGQSLWASSRAFKWMISSLSAAVCTCRCSLSVDRYSTLACKFDSHCFLRCRHFNAAKKDSTAQRRTDKLVKINSLQLVPFSPCQQVPQFFFFSFLGFFTLAIALQKVLPFFLVVHLVLRCGPLLARRGTIVGVARLIRVLADFLRRHLAPSHPAHKGRLDPVLGQLRRRHHAGHAGQGLAVLGWPMLGWLLLLDRLARVLLLDNIVSLLLMVMLLLIMVVDIRMLLLEMTLHGCLPLISLSLDPHLSVGSLAEEVQVTVRLWVFWMRPSLCHISLVVHLRMAWVVVRLLLLLMLLRLWLCWCWEGEAIFHNGSVVACRDRCIGGDRVLRPFQH